MPQCKRTGRGSKPGNVKKQSHKKANAVPRMSAEEKRLAREMHFDQGMSRTEVAEALNRNLGTICRQLAMHKAPKPIGRPKALTETKVDSLVTSLEKMVDEAGSRYEVTLPMLMKRSKVKASYRVVADALHERGFWFRSLRAKPILTPQDGGGSSWPCAPAPTPSPCPPPRRRSRPAHHSPRPAVAGEAPGAAPAAGPARVRQPASSEPSTRRRI